MHLLAHLLQVCIFILINTMTSGHVLFAANVDDFRSLTKKFMPELADRLSGLGAKIKNNHRQPVKLFKPVSKTEETDLESLYRPSQESEELLGTISKPAYFEPKGHAIRYVSNKSSEESSAGNVPEYADTMQKDEESKQYEENAYVNLETEAVEKSESETKEMEREVALRNPRTYFNKGQLELQKNIQERPRSAKQKKVRTVQVNLEQLVEKVKKRILRDLEPKINKSLKKSSIKANMKLTRLLKRPTEHAIREKVEKTTPKKGKNNDWYEKEPKLFGEPKIKQKVHVNDKVNQRPRKPVQSQAKGNKDDEIVEEYDILTKVKLSSDKKKDSYEDYVAPKKERHIFESNETLPPQKEMRFKQRTREFKKFNTVRPMAAGNKETLKTTTPEYDDYQETTNEAELKARTENIGDYDDHKQIDNTRITSQKTNNKLNTKDITVAAKGKDKKSKLGTMIPTREIYKMSSPNYYGKLPKIAERYKFDEPIPFKDMEDENLKPVGNPPANINGKVRV